jgi:hypothetical protein
LGAYLVHLAVPLIFLVDSLQAARRGDAGTVEKTVIVVTALWVLLGLGALAFAGDRVWFPQAHVPAFGDFLHAGFLFGSR